MKLKLSLITLLIAALFSPATAFSEVDWRCTGVHNIDQSDTDDIAVQLGANCVRIQLGFNSEMDGLTGSAYTARLQTEINKVKNDIQLIANSGMKTLLSFYSPPGGFQTRTTPAHHAIFSSLALQSQYLDAIQLIVSEFANNPNVIGIDLNNEPAIRDDLLCVGCKKWEDLVVDAISAARSISPDTLLVVKPIFGSSDRLTRLPFFTDPNVYYGYHHYYYLQYLHAGIDGVSTDIDKPKFLAHKDKAERSLGKFARVWNKRRNKSDVAGIPAKAPIFMTEAAVSNLGKEPAAYITDTLNIIEGIGENSSVNIKRIQKKLKKCKLKDTNKKRKKCNKKFKRKLNAASTDQYLEMKGWSWHSLFEAFVWDCRRAPVADSFPLVGYNTDRCQALKAGFLR